MTTTFAEKNLARKAFSKSIDPQKMSARKARRACSGVFGRAKASDYNFLAIGTTAHSKSTA